MKNTFLIRTAAELHAEKENWNRLAGSFPFHRWEWMMAWVNHVHPDFELAILIQTDDHGDWVGIAPFCIQTTRTYARKINFIACGSACSDYSTLICKPENTNAFVNVVADWLIEASRDSSIIGGFDILEFDGVASDDAAIQFLLEILRSEQFLSHKTELEGCWVADLPESWQEMNSSFSKSLRRKTKSAIKNLDDEKTRIISSKDVGLAGVWNTFVELHQKRRQMLGEAGCFNCADFEAFLIKATSELANEGLAEIVIVEHDGSPVAGMLIFNDGNKSMMYQSGIDPEFMAACPGYQLIVQAIRSSIENGFEKFDFLRGDEPYKARWKTTRVPLVRIRMAPPKLLSAVRQGVWSSAKTVKALLESTSDIINVKALRS